MWDMYRHIVVGVSTKDNHGYFPAARDSSRTFSPADPSPPASIVLHRGCNYRAVAFLHQRCDIGSRDAGADDHGKNGVVSDHGNLVDRSGVTGARTRRDQNICVEELGVFGLFRDSAVRDNGMRTVFDVHVSEDPDRVGADAMGGSVSSWRPDPR